MQMADYKTEALAYLRSVIDQTGKTATELARLAGVNQTTFTRPLNSPDHKYAVKFQALQELAEKTGVGLPASLVSARAAPKRSVQLRLPIQFKVGAGGFERRDEIPQQVLGYETVASVPPYTDAPQWLELVSSDSMDRSIPVGSCVHVVDAFAINYKPHHNDIVIVERTMAQDAYVERTVKRLKLTPDGPQLWPDSHNKRWSGPLVLGDDPALDASDDTRTRAQIVGLVLRSYQFHIPSPDSAEPV